MKDEEELLGKRQREGKKTLTTAEVDTSFPMATLVYHSNWDVKEKH